MKDLTPMTDPIKQLKPATHLAISGRTMEFDGKGKCVAGC